MHKLQKCNGIRLSESKAVCMYIESHILKGLFLEELTHRTVMKYFTF